MHGLSIGGSRPRDWNDLHWATWCQDLDRVKTLLSSEHCAHLLREKDALGWTPLHLACVSTSSAKLKFGCGTSDENSRSFPGRSEASLHHSRYAYTYSRYGDNERPEEVLAFFILLDLLHAGADVGARTKSGLAGLHLASRSGWVDHIKALRYWGASIHDAPGFSPALFAAGPAQDYLMAKLGPYAWRCLQKNNKNGPRLPDFRHTAPGTNTEGLSETIPFTLPGTFDSVVETATPPTCQHCSSISLASLQQADGFQHGSFSSLKTSSEGCSLCFFLFRLLSRLRRPTEEDGDTLIVLRSRPGTDWKATQALRIQLVSVDEAGGLPCVLEDVCIDMFTSDYEASVLNKVQFGRIPTPDSRAEEALNICSSWLEQCEQNHGCEVSKPETASEHRASESTAKRLIDVSDCITTGNVRLVSGSCGCWDRYVALSHRWVSGALPSWVTTSANVAQRTRRFGVDQLPATMQDAILLTHKLGMKYIWIDSLCIVQNSEKDWKEESVKMSSVFGCASLTIFTDCAVDDNDVFLRERTASSFQKRQGIQIRVGGVNGTFLLHLVEQYTRYAKKLPAKTTDLFRADVAQSGLSTRGWILQEQATSLRQLHFGSHQMYWACRRHVKAEDGTDLRASSPPWMGWLSAYPRTENLKYDANTQTPNRTHILSHAANWAHLLEGYTSRSLTKASDRYVAISALAQSFGARTGHSWTQYLAGCWSRQIHLDILWVAKGAPKVKPSKTTGSETRTSVMPSWSWVAKAVPKFKPSKTSQTRMSVVPSWSWVKLHGPIEYPYLKERGSREFGTQFTASTHHIQLWANRKKNPEDKGCLSEIDATLAVTPLIITGVLERDVRIGKRQRVGSGRYNVPPWLHRSEDFVGDTLPLSDGAGLLLGHMIPDEDEDGDEDAITRGAEIALLTLWTSHGLCPCCCQTRKPKDRHFLVLTPCDVSRGATWGGKTYRRIGYGWHYCRNFDIEEGSGQHYGIRGAYYEKWKSPRETFGLV